MKYILMMRPTFGKYNKSKPIIVYFNTKKDLNKRIQHLKGLKGAYEYVWAKAPKIK